MISLNLDGVNDAIETVTEIIVPWRRKNSKRKATLENVLRQAEIQRINAEILIATAKARREQAATELDQTQKKLILSQARKTEAEARLVIAQAEKTFIDAERERTSLRQAQIELATRVIEKYAPEMSGAQKMDYVIRLLPILDTLISSDVFMIEETPP